MITSANAPTAAPAEYMGLSTDTKPDNLGTNALFLELDTLKIKYFDGEEWREIGEEIPQWVTLYENDALFFTYHAGGGSPYYDASVEIEGQLIANTLTRLSVGEATIEAVSEVQNVYGTVVAADEEGHYQVNTHQSDLSSLSIFIHDEQYTSEEGVTLPVKIEQVR